MNATIEGVQFQRRAKWRRCDYARRKRDFASRCRRYIVREIEPYAATSRKDNRFQALVQATPHSLRSVETNSWGTAKLYRKRQRAIDACLKHARKSANGQDK